MFATANSWGRVSYFAYKLALTIDLKRYYQASVQVFVWQIGCGGYGFELTHDVSCILAIHQADTASGR